MSNLASGAESAMPSRAIASPVRGPFCNRLIGWATTTNQRGEKCDARDDQRAGRELTSLLLLKPPTDRAADDEDQAERCETGAAGRARGTIRAAAATNTTPTNANVYHDTFTNRPASTRRGSAIQSAAHRPAMTARIG